MRYLEKYNENGNKTCLILHGKSDSKKEYEENDSPSNNHWIPWLQKQLCLNDILTQTPEFPIPYDPSYNEWVKVFEQFKINKNTILIGHSYGAGFLIKYLSQNDIKVDKVILIAPYLDKLLIDKKLSDRNNITIFYSTDDDKNILKTVEFIQNNLDNLVIKKYSDKEHFTMKKVSEILSFILN